MSTDWNQLSPKGFERVVRDLMAKHFKCLVESFTEGTDGGIDLRTHNEKTIIQCKRYKSFNQLYNKLKKESNIICSIFSDKRYILITSLGLTPANKKKIRTLIPIISTSEDILGADDLEGILANNPEIRKLYPELWLGDEKRLVDIIKQATNRFIDNSTQEEYQKIIYSMKYMVRHPKFERAIEMLEENRALIITGPPGIGKTSLANNLIYHITQESKEYEFIFISKDIKEAEQMYDRNKKQVFLYDDFLGSNFLKDRLTKNEDRGIYNFIEKITKTTNKLLILTTREYIFQQAIQEYAHVKNAGDIVQKLILDVSSVSIDFKAEILYNHLWTNRTPGEAINTLLQRKHNTYNDIPILFHIIEHKSYNPRIVATYTSLQNKREQSIDFAHGLLHALDHPFNIYENIFRNNLSDSQKQILLIIGTYPKGATFDEIESAYYETSEFKYTDSLRYDLRVLEGDFITSNKTFNNEILIDYINPGIRDFIYQYININKNLLLLIKISNSIEQIQHLYNLVQEKGSLSSLNGKFESIIVSKGIYIINKSIEDGKYSFSFLAFANSVYEKLGSDKSHFLTAIVESEDKNEFQYLNYDTVDIYFDFFTKIIKNEKIGFNLGLLCQNALDIISTFDIIEILYDFLSLVENSHYEYKTFSLETDDWQYFFLQSAEDLDIEDIEVSISQMESFMKNYRYPFNINVQSLIDDLENIITEKEGKEKDYDDDDSWYRQENTKNNEHNDKQQIISDFQNLAQEMSCI